MFKRRAESLEIEHWSNKPHWRDKNIERKKEKIKICIQDDCKVLTRVINWNNCGWEKWYDISTNIYRRVCSSSET